MNIILRVVKRIKRDLNKVGIFIPIRQYECLQARGSSRVLVVGPGSISIPAIGWGAVETVVSETISQYIHLDAEVWLLNSRHYKDWKAARKIKFDLIISHSDFHTLKIRKFWPEAYSIGVSHYGYAAFPEKWNHGYGQILKNLSLHNKVVCLSKAVFKEYSKYISVDKLLLSHNGSEFKPNLNIEKIQTLVCVGKVEERKKQFELYEAFKEQNRLIHFIGHIEDERVKNEIKLNPDARKYFIGPFTRQEIARQLAKYLALILLSDGEGDALVLYEAQLAGLPIIVSESALGAQDPSLDWVKVISKNWSLTEIDSVLESVKSGSVEIANYARENFTWEKRNKPLLELCVSILGNVDVKST